MKVIISQQDLPAGRHGKKILIEFYSDAPQGGGRSPDLCVGVDKADGFINAVDKFFRKRSIKPIGQIKFKNTGVLTERIIRATILGLRF